MDIINLLEVYKNDCPYFDDFKYLEVQNGDIISIVNIGADFARAGMFENAVKCWEYVANLGQGNSEVYSNLAVSYYYGNGVQQDYKKAVKYYQRAAASGHPFGMYNLAVANEYGNGTPKNMEKAVSFYKRSAEKGVAMAIDALIRLGLYDELEGLAYYGRDMEEDSFSGNL